ncbi:MAG TPA: hypothetical protein VEL49_09560 [Ktedonobacteraceae bacterium]|nr:hypothetical protein [Ktedonobacteraceae bacterium]
MGEQRQNSGGFQLGDKVRIRSGSYVGVRGVIRSESDGLFEIQLDEDGIASVPAKEVTNYSLAARRAWQAMPKRAGRPKGQKPVKRMVSMRLDADIWDMLQEATELGLIPSREKAVNDWVREQIILLLSKDE